jgi:hypothetical protein
LLSFVESAPRAYRLKASNAAPPFSTSAGTSAGRDPAIADDLGHWSPSFASGFRKTSISARNA